MSGTRLAGTRPGLGLLDPSTYRTSLSLVADLVVGTATFTVMVTLLALSAGLVVTLLGIPLLLLTLLVARAVGVVERRRAGTPPRTATVRPARSRNGSGTLDRLAERLTDAEDWRAVVYCLLLFPVGLVAGTVTVAGWTTAVAAITAPAYATWTGDPHLRVAGVDPEGPLAALVSVIAGVVLLLAMPTIVRTLGRIKAALVRQLLA